MQRAQPGRLMRGRRRVGHRRKRLGLALAPGACQRWYGMVKQGGAATAQVMMAPLHQHQQPGLLLAVQADRVLKLQQASARKKTATIAMAAGLHMAGRKEASVRVQVPMKHLTPAVLHHHHPGRGPALQHAVHRSAIPGIYPWHSWRGCIVWSVCITKWISST